MRVLFVRGELSLQARDSNGKPGCGTVNASRIKDMGILCTFVPPVTSDSSSQSSCSEVFRFPTLATVEPERGALRQAAVYPGHRHQTRRHIMLEEKPSQEIERDKVCGAEGDCAQMTGRVVHDRLRPGGEK
jgi:hypothetical protein